MTTKKQLPVIRQLSPKTTLKKNLFYKTLAIPLKHEIRVISLGSILYLRSDSNYTEIHLTDGSKIVASSTLKNYEAKLNTLQFIRVHNSYIIQKSQISSFLPSENKIILRSSQAIPVSRSRKEGLLSYLKTMMV